MGLPVVVQQPHGPLQPPHGHVHLDSLVPGHRRVLVVMHHEEGGPDLVGLEEGGVVEVAEGLLPQRAPDPALGALVLELSAHAAAPANAPVGAGHVGDRGPGFRGGEEVRPGDHVGDLVAAPGVPLHADAVRIHVPLVRYLEHTGHHGVQGALPGMADLVGDVRDEEDVAPAHVEGGNHRGAPGSDRGVAVQPVRHPLVEVHHHGVRLRGIEVLRLDQHPLEGNPVVGGPLHQLRRAPEVLGLLRIGVRDPVPVLEVQVRDPQVRVFLEGLPGEDVQVGLIRLAGHGEREVLHEELPGRLGPVEAVPVESVLLGVDVEGAQEHVFVGGDGIGVIQGSAEPGVVRLGIHVPEPDIVLPAHPLGEVLRWPAVQGIHAPEVEPVIDQKGLVVFQPPGGPVRWGGLGMVIQLVPDGVRQVFGDVSGHPFLHVHDEPVLYEAFPVVEVASVGRESPPVGKTRIPELLHHQLRLPGGHVDEVDVTVGGVVGNQGSVLQGGQARRHVPFSLGRYHHLPDLLRGQLDHPPVSGGGIGQVGAFPLPVGPDLLHGLDEGILPVPDVHHHALVFRYLLLRLGLRAGGRTEEETGAVVGEGRVPVLAHPPAVGDPRGALPGHDLGFSPVQHGVVESELGLVRLPVVPVREEGQTVLVVGDGHTRVLPFAGENAPGLTRARVHGVDPVRRSVLVGGRVDEPGPFLGEGVGRDVLEPGLGSGLQIPEDEGGSLFLVPLLLFLRFLLTFGLRPPGFFHLFLRGFPFLLLCLFLLQEVGQVGSLILGNLPGPHPGPADDLRRPRRQTGEVHDSQGVLWEVVSPRSLGFQGVHHGFHGLDGEDQEPGVGSDGGIGAPIHHHGLLSAIRQGPDAEDPVPFTRIDLVDHPGAVGGDHSGSNGIPDVVGVVVQGLLGAFLGPCRRRKGQKEEKGETARQSSCGVHDQTQSVGGIGFREVVLLPASSFGT